MKNINQFYFDLLLSRKDDAQASFKLKESNNDSKVYPFSILESRDLFEFKLFKYEDLKVNTELLKRVELKIIKMQAGLGSSVERKDLLDKYTDRTKMSAKAIDLFINYQGETISIAEAQLRSFNQLQSRKIYKKVTFQNLVNEETKEDLNKTLGDYDYLESIEQEKMPTLNSDEEICYDYKAPGGHGFIGFCEIQDALLSDSNEITCIGNGEDLNSTVDEKIISLVVSEKIPILMITTDKTKKDLKGGQLSLVKGKVPYITIVEKAQAERAGQLSYFEELGLRPSDNKALFNTNIVVINKKALRDLIRGSVKELNISQFFKDIAPDVIKNKKEYNGNIYVQLEGALGSIILNLDKYFRLNFSKKILGIVNLNESERELFFLPIKKREDYDHLIKNYHFDSNSLKLVKN